MDVLILNSSEYKLIDIILDVDRFRLYKPVQTGSLEANVSES